MTRDRLLGFALLLAAWGEQLSGGRTQLTLHLALAALMILPLAFARRRPWIPAVACAAGLVAYGLLGQEPDATGEIFAIAGAAFLAGSRLALRPGIAAIAVIAVGGALHLALVGGIADLLFIVGVFLVPPFLLGRGVRGRRRRIDELTALNRALVEERERSARLASEIERARITRDLETIVARSLDEMIEHARRGERLEGADAAQAFEAIRARGAEATAELRRLLRMLHA